MKFNLTESERERILNLHMEKGYRQPINEDLLPSDFGTPQPHKAEDFVELDYDSSNETVVLYFNDETTETFQIDTRASYSPGEESSYDSPGYDADFEVVISSVKQVEPIERTWEVRQFEDYLQSLGAMEQLNDTLHNEDAYDSAAESYYHKGYDEDAYRDRDLDEGFDVKGNASQMYDMTKNRLDSAIGELFESIQKGDKGMSMHMLMVLKHLLRTVDEAVQDLKKS